MSFTWNIGGKLREIETPCVMGIVNATPDSFHAPSRASEPLQAVETAKAMIGEGCGWLDIGAFSTRPGHETISIQEEIERLVPVALAIEQAFPDVLISIDTFRSEVVEACAKQLKAFIVNDISGGVFDPQLAEAAAAARKLPAYSPLALKKIGDLFSPHESGNIIREANLFFSKQISHFHLSGVADIAIDPGFGFAKNIEQNYEMLAKLDQLKIHHLPILAGISRKSMIWKYLGITSDESLPATTALHLQAILKGADISRVHDVKEAVQAVSLARIMGKFSENGDI